MNEDTFGGEIRDITGKVEETAGNLTGDATLQSEGLADQFSGKVQKVMGATREAWTSQGEPFVEKASRFARERPFATAALASVLGIALINTLRGRARAATGK